MRRLFFLVAAIHVSFLSYANTAHKSATKMRVITSKNRISSSIHPRDIPTPDSDAPIKINGNAALQRQVALVSNYVFRGISQTNNNPALQGGLVYFILNSSAYISVWGSNVSFVDSRAQPVTVEADTVIGVAKTINKDLNFDIRLSRYNYPGASNNSYNELNAFLNYSVITSQISYSNDEYARGKSGLYYNLGLNYPIPSKYLFNLESVRISGGVGYFDLPVSVGLQSYQDYSVAITKSTTHLVYSIQWTDTNGHSVDPRALKHNLITVMIGFNL